MAINPASHGRDKTDLDLCDVCYWRKRAEYERAMVHSCGPTCTRAGCVNARLRAALQDAIDSVESWGAYASPYFQEKWDLAGDIKRLQAVLDQKS